MRRYSCQVPVVDENVDSVPAVTCAQGICVHYRRWWTLVERLGCFYCCQTNAGRRLRMFHSSFYQAACLVVLQNSRRGRILQVSNKAVYSGSQEQGEVRLGNTTRLRGGFYGEIARVGPGILTLIVQYDENLYSIRINPEPHERHNIPLDLQRVRDKPAPSAAWPLCRSDRSCL